MEPTAVRRRLLTPAQAAKRLGVSLRTVRRWADNDLVALTVHTPLPGRPRYDADEVEALRAALKGSPIAEDGAA